jgi:hypothetical protein
MAEPARVRIAAPNLAQEHDLCGSEPLVGLVVTSVLKVPI